MQPDNRRYGMRHELLTQCALFGISSDTKKVHAESAIHDACHTSPGLTTTVVDCSKLVVQGFCKWVVCN